MDQPNAGAVLEDPIRYSDPDSKSSIVTVYSMAFAPSEDESSTQLEAIAKLAVPLSYAKQGIQVLRVDATSMEPIIMKGSHVGIDTAQKNIISGELYGIYMPFEGVVLKRVYIDGDNARFILRSDNPNHPEQYIPIAQRSERIFGRVVWMLQRF